MLKCLRQIICFSPHPVHWVRVPWWSYPGRRRIDGGRESLFNDGLFNDIYMPDKLLPDLEIVSQLWGINFWK